MTIRTDISRSHEPCRKAYSIREFYTAYGLSRAKTYQLIRLGELAAVKLGTRTLIPVESAEAWFKALPTVRSEAPEGKIL